MSILESRLNSYSSIPAAPYRCSLHAQASSRGTAGTRRSYLSRRLREFARDTSYAEHDELLLSKLLGVLNNT